MEVVCDCCFCGVDDGLVEVFVGVEDLLDGVGVDGWVLVLECLEGVVEGLEFLGCGGADGFLGGGEGPLEVGEHFGFLGWWPVFSLVLSRFFLCSGFFWFLRWLL